MSQRTESMGHILQRALSPLLLGYEPKYGLVSVIRVEVQADFKKATVFLSSEKYTRQLCTVLQKKARYFERELRPALMQQLPPQLEFRVDMGELHAKHMDALLSD